MPDVQAAVEQDVPPVVNLEVLRVRRPAAINIPGEVDANGAMDSLIRSRWAR